MYIYIFEAENFITAIFMRVIRANVLSTNHDVAQAFGCPLL